ncbi:alpha/beta fold hydrolase [Actinomadura verrucosospora]|uniref:alpha/beta fold hydrolase n=1 Tax=Actinomadura verrucosospora TaxID=46165 RepID=UPI001C202A8B
MTEFVRTVDLDIGYEVSGPPDGPPLVAVHGWPDDPHCWNGLLPSWHDGGYRVYRPFLRGFGPTRFRSDAKMRSGQIGALGHDLGCFLEALDLDQVLLVGHDWGARAGYVVGALFPQRVARLVAMSAGYATNRADAQLSWPLTHAYWYEWFVATERGRRAMHEYRRSFAATCGAPGAQDGNFRRKSSPKRPTPGTTTTGRTSPRTPICTAGAKRTATPPMTTSSSTCSSPPRSGFRRWSCTVPRTATTCPRPPLTKAHFSPLVTGGSSSLASGTSRPVRHPTE